MDPDDEILPELLIDNVSLMEEYKADLIIFKAWRGNSSGYKSINKKISRLTKRDFFKSYEILSREFGIAEVWNKIYRADKIRCNNLAFINYNYAEDAIFNIKFYNSCTSIITNDAQYYIYYTDREEGLSRVISSDRYNGYLYYSKILKKSFADCGIQTDYPYRDKVHFFYTLRKKVSAEHVHRFVNYLFPIKTNDIKTKIKLFILWLNSKKIRI